MEKKNTLEEKLNFFELKTKDIIGEDYNPPYRFNFENKAYNEKEKNFIKTYKKTYSSQYETLEKSYWTDEQLLIFIQGSKFNLEAAQKNIDLHIKWRKDTILNPSYYDNTDELLKKGILYFGGRDNRYRPILVVSLKKMIDSKIDEETMLKIFVRFSRKICDEFFVYGKIENFVIILDMIDVSFFSLPINTLKRNGKIFEANFRTKMFKFFVINAPWTVSALFVFAKAFDSNIQKKIVVSRQNHPVEMKFINEHQLEKKYGGVKKDVEIFWPIQETDLDPKKIFVDENDFKDYSNKNEDKKEN